MHLTRRQFLGTASAVAAASFLPSILAARVGPLVVGGGSNRSLILVELEGGNDGLNTIVPLSGWSSTGAHTGEHLIYRNRRPSLRLGVTDNIPGLGATGYQTNCLQLGTNSATGFSGGTISLAGDAMRPDFAIHAGMNSLAPAWRAGDLAVVLGVGYADSSRSHFRGIDIWNTGTTGIASDGWLARMMQAEGFAATARVDGVLLGNQQFSPLVGVDGLRLLAMDDPNDFLDNSELIAIGDPNPDNPIPPLVTGAPASTGNPALDRILQARWQVVEARSRVDTAMQASDGKPVADYSSLKASFGTTGFGKQCWNTFRCIAGGLVCPVYKLALGGFDNHTNQKNKHADLLAELANGLAALRAALMTSGTWDSTLVMTYSEFGRRVEENGSQGTDHGTAAPHFFMGGRVNGGLYGTQPTLALAQPWYDMDATMDFRRMYATAADWLTITSPNQTTGFRGASYAPVGGLWS